MICETEEWARRLVQALSAAGKTLAGAESCTGGLIASEITSVSGASAVFCGAVVSYTNQVKNQVLGVKQATLDEFTAVSEEVAAQMAEGAARLMKTDFAYSVTGYAGPGGGTPDRPVGTVCFGFFSASGTSDLRTKTATVHFDGDRNQVRAQAAVYVLKTLAEIL